MAFRMRWPIGSPTSSSSDRSSSVSRPSSVSVDLLAELRRKVAHQSREAAEDRLDRHHPEVRDAGLESIDDLGELAGAVLGLGREDILAQPGRELPGLASQARLLDDQLPDEVHEVVELGDVDPDGVGGRRAG